MVSTDHFRQEIRSRLELASAQGGRDLTIECGELCRSVSKLPVSDRWMIFCCNAMRAEMAISDEVIFDHAKETLLKSQIQTAANENQVANVKSTPLG